VTAESVGISIEHENKLWCWELYVDYCQNEFSGSQTAREFPRLVDAQLNIAFF